MSLKKESMSQSYVYNHFHKQLIGLDKKLQATFSQIREEFDDHLVAINENTEEMQSFQNYLCDLDEKIDKLNARIDNIHLALRSITSEKKDIMLSVAEQKLFLLMYTFENGFLSLEDISVRARLTVEEVRSLVSSLLDKGVSLVREVADGQVFFKLNPQFRERQVKEQVVRIDPAVVQQSQNKMLGAFF